MSIPRLNSIPEQLASQIYATFLAALRRYPYSWLPNETVDKWYDNA